MVPRIDDALSFHHPPLHWAGPSPGLPFLFHTPHPMPCLQNLLYPVHDILAHFVIFSKLAANAGIEGILEVGTLSFSRKSKSDSEVPICNQFFDIAFNTIEQRPRLDPAKESNQ
jgi:hypothetical protein